MKSIDQEKAQMYLKKTIKTTLHTFKIRIFSLGPKIHFGFIRARVAFINKSGAEVWMRSKQSKQSAFYTQNKDGCNNMRRCIHVYSRC